MSIMFKAIYYGSSCFLLFFGALLLLINLIAVMYGNDPRDIVILTNINLIYGSIGLLFLVISKGFSMSVKFRSQMKLIRQEN